MSAIELFKIYIYKLEFTETSVVLVSTNCNLK